MSCNLARRRIDFYHMLMARPHFCRVSRAASSLAVSIAGVLIWGPEKQHNPRAEHNVHLFDDNVCIAVDFCGKLRNDSYDCHRLR